jgi:hypothetical protein
MTTNQGPYRENNSPNNDNIIIANLDVGLVKLIIHTISFGDIAFEIKGNAVYYKADKKWCITPASTEARIRIENWLGKNGICISGLVIPWSNISHIEVGDQESYIEKHRYTLADY